MKLFELEPEVAGGFGENTIIENPYGKRPIIKHLHYEFSGWLGDDILETTPCFIITKLLADTIQKSNFTGYKIEDVEVSESSEFKELYPNRSLPEFKWLIPLGEVEINNGKFSNWSGDDFCMSQEYTLVVTEKVINILQIYNINYCEIKERS